MHKNLFHQEKLYCPGPTPVPLSIHLAGIERSVYHRSEDFYETFNHCRKLLRPFFNCKDDPLILTSSGTGAMEAASVNFTEEGDQVLVVSAGKFGDRWRQINEAYNNKVKVLAIEWGLAVQPKQVLSALKEMQRPKALFIQLNETSTGVHMPIKEIAEAIRAQPEFKDLLIIVDAISGMCAHAVDMQGWDLDVVLSGSQKGFGIPPGLAFIASSERAIMRRSTRGCFYFDLERERKGQAQGQSSWTPASTLVLSLHEALKIMSSIGVAEVLNHHQRLCHAVRAGIESIGCQPLVAKNYSYALTSILLPEGLDASKLLTQLQQQYGVVMAGGQDQLKGKIIRMAHLGMVDVFHCLNGLSALEWALADLNVAVEVGAGTAAAMQSWHQQKI